MTQAEPATNDKVRRTRASENALRITLAVMQEAGLSVDKVCVTGGKVEIHCAPIAGKPAAKKDEGLKEW